MSTVLCVVFVFCVRAEPSTHARPTIDELLEAASSADTLVARIELWDQFDSGSDMVADYITRAF